MRYEDREGNRHESTAGELISVVRWRSHGLTVGVRHIEEGEAREALKSTGILVRSPGETDAGSVYISRSHPALERLYRGTRWVEAYAQQLLRLDGAIRKQKNQRFGNLSTRAEILPGSWFALDDDEAGPSPDSVDDIGEV